jgi:hypothetical protein
MYWFTGFMSQSSSHLYVRLSNGMPGDALLAEFSFFHGQRFRDYFSEEISLRQQGFGRQKKPTGMLYFGSITLGTGLEA